MTLNAMNKSSDSDIYFKYGDRLEALEQPNGGEDVEVYSFTASHIVTNTILIFLPRASLSLGR